MDRRFLLVGVLALVVALAAMVFLTTAAQAAGDVKVVQDTPPDPEWERQRELALQRLRELQTKWEQMTQDTTNPRKLEMLALDFAQAHNWKVRHSDRFYDMRERRFNNGYRDINRDLGLQQQGQGQGTQQGAGQGTQQGTGQGTQQGTGQGTQQGAGQGTQQGGTGQGGELGVFRADDTRTHRPLRLGGRCREIVGNNDRTLGGLAQGAGVSYNEVAGRLCSGTRVVDMRLGYWISRRAGITPDEVFAQRGSGKSWQAILDTYDLKYDKQQP